MAKVIDVPGFGPTEFPDEMGDDEIVAAIQRNMIPAPKQKEPEPVAGWKQTLGGWVDSANKIVPALKESAESALEPIATIGSGLVGEVAGNIAGMGSGLYSKITGQPDVSNEVKREFAEALTYQPRSKSAQANLQSIGKFMQSDAGKAIQGLPIAGNELAMLGRLAGPAAQQVVRPVAQSSGEGLKLAAQSWMENALKGTVKQAERGDVAIAAKELLKRDISPNKAGVAAIEARLAQLQEEVAREIAGSTAQINKQKVIDRLQSVRDKFIKTVNPEADLAAISTTGGRFAEHPLIPGETMSAQLAQDLKKGTYQELRKKYGELGSAETEAQKALARGLKEELDVAIPGIGALNAEEAALYKTLGVAERRQIQEAMKDPLTHSGAYSKPIIYATLALNKSAAAKALLARLLNRAGKALAPEMKAQPAVLPAPTSTLPVPYVSRGDVNPEVPYRPNWVPSKGYGPTVSERQPQTSGLLGVEDDFSRMAKQREAFTREQTRQTAREGEVMPRDPNWQPYRPPLLEDARRIDIPNEPSAIRNQFANQRRLVDAEAVKIRAELASAEAEYAAWAKESAARVSEARKAALNERANNPRVMSDAEKRMDKLVKRDAKARMELQQRIRQMKDKEAQLLQMQRALEGPRAGTEPFIGQGRKTREFTGMLGE